MYPRHVVMVTRKYWPLAGVTESHLGDLSSELAKRGVRVTVLTAQMEKHWPLGLVIGAAEVVRVPYSSDLWGTFRYLSGIAKWVRKHKDEFDLAFVSELKYEAYTVVGELRKSPIPVVLRAAAGGAAGDCRWHETAHFGQRVRKRCRQADAVLAPSSSARRELQAAGFSDQQTDCFPRGTAEFPSRSEASQRAARESLGDLHDLFSLDNDAPLAVYIGDLHTSLGLKVLVQSWPLVLERWPRARLWILGEGPDGLDIWQLVRRLDLTERVIMPGMFDDLEEVLHAADLFIQPSFDEGQSTALVAAAAAGLPIVTTDTDDSRELLNPQLATFVPPRDVDSLGRAIADLFGERDATRRRAEQCRRFVNERYGFEQSVDRLFELFQSLQERKSGVKE